MSTIGMRIRSRRKELGLKQTELAKLMGVSQPTLSNLENGTSEKPAGATLAGLCKALRTTSRWIMEGRGDHDMSPNTDEELKMLELWRRMTPEQRATWLKLGKVLSEDPPPTLHVSE